MLLRALFQKTKYFVKRRGRGEAVTVGDVPAKGKIEMESKRGFDHAKYSAFSQDHLIALALWFLLQEGKEPSFENLVAESFSSFPSRFQLEGYPDWPNAHVVGKSWVRCRTDKKWLTGSASQGFALTPLGEKIAEQVLSRLDKASRASQQVNRKGSRQSISSRVVLHLESSPAYQKFRSGFTEEISEYEFCEILYCTLESTPETFEKNFSVVRQQAEAYGRRDLTRFLDALRDRFSNRFVGKRARGGLMPQKKEG